MLLYHDNLLVLMYFDPMHRPKTNIIYNILIKKKIAMIEYLYFTSPSLVNARE